MNFIRNLLKRATQRAPRRIRINNDQYSAKWAGRTRDGLQFFATTPFVPSLGDEPGCEFIAIYLWKRDGAFHDAKIDSLGPRQTLDEDQSTMRFAQRIGELGPLECGPIEVAPFEVERFGVKFGFIAQSPEEDDDEWCVIAEPGNYMAFFPPWKGDYDT